jgi:molybdopterin/thiamine biosynthesis adenylyltransferase
LDLTVTYIGIFVIVDPQTIEGTNLTRLVGGTAADLSANTVKVEIAKRLIQGVRPEARVSAYRDDWRNVVPALRRCDVILAAVDTYRDRNELERQARRSLTPYLDIGMDISKIGNEYYISGQIALSIPGGPCLWCMGISVKIFWRWRLRTTAMPASASRSSGRMASWRRLLSVC